MIRKIRRDFEEVKGRKHHVFDDLAPLVERCLKHYPQLFPNHRVNKNGSKSVYHFGIDGLMPISLEKEHGSREYLPRHYAKLAMGGIEELLIFIEGCTADVKDASDEEQLGGTDDADKQK